MNKNDFINTLSSKINYSKEDCLIINDILEKFFFISKKNKDIIVEELCKTFNIEEYEAVNIYDTAKDILNEEIKYKLKHPFGNKKNLD